MINKRQLKMHFDRNASNYDEFANVQRKMADVIIDKLKEEKSDSDKIYKILDLGCGTGTLSKKVSQLFSNGEITAIDISKNMINIARNNLEKCNVKYICADIEKIKICDKFDIIVSNATFQWFEDLDETLIQILKYLKEGGVLFFSTFGENTFNELYKSYELSKTNLGIKDNIQPGQNFYSFDNIKKIINSCSENYEVSGFEENEVELFNSVKDFLYSIKKIGANNSNNRKNNNPRIVKDMIKLYDQNYKINNKIRATYHCMYFLCKKENKNGFEK
ncbi:MAG: malonyl-ACP O-methyltransferase BioC [Clostridiales bacterium]